MQANDQQVGGTHYKSDFQHWDFVLMLEMPYLDAQISRYVSRWQKKNGVEDLKKALHYTDKLIEIEHKRHEQSLQLLANYKKANNVDRYESRILGMLINYRLGDGDRLLEVRNVLQGMIASIEGNPLPQIEDPQFLSNSDEWRT